MSPLCATTILLQSLARPFWVGVADDKMVEDVEVTVLFVGMEDVEIAVFFSVADFEDTPT